MIAAASAAVAAASAAVAVVSAATVTAIGVPAAAYVTGVVLIVILSVLAGLLPSLEASRLKITDALRKV